MKSLLIVSLLLVSFSAAARDEARLGSSKIQMSQTYAKSGDKIARWEPRFVGHSRIQKVELLPSEISQYRQVDASDLLSPARDPANSLFGK